MSRNRFERPMQCIHLVSNSDVPQEDKDDKVWKLRPWISSLQCNFTRVQQEELNTVDEIMVAFMERSKPPLTFLVVGHRKDLFCVDDAPWLLLLAPISSKPMLQKKAAIGGRRCLRYRFSMLPLIGTLMIKRLARLLLLTL
uniref:PiggyBac transposable element-derived protein domain-containing protein n=1 Tax=Ixodes ricinus TaxID=34613 RepID=A0A0K8RA89_IXORI